MAARERTTTICGRRFARGITVVHINTELRVAWRARPGQGLAKDRDDGGAYKILPFAVDAGSVKWSFARLKVFNMLDATRSAAQA